MNSEEIRNIKIRIEHKEDKLVQYENKVKDRKIMQIINDLKNNINQLKNVLKNKLQDYNIKKQFRDQVLQN